LNTLQELFAAVKGLWRVAQGKQTGDHAHQVDVFAFRRVGNRRVMVRGAERCQIGRQLPGLVQARSDPAFRSAERPARKASQAARNADFRRNQLRTR
jgi:hypothetical protein